MFPFANRHVRDGRQFIKDARKLVAYKRDVVSESTVADVEREIQKLEAAVKEGDERVIGEQMQRLDTTCGAMTKPHPDAAWRENVEVFLVAIVIALAVRTYFLQPFTIPTGSMQPTLNGIVAHPSGPAPNALSAMLQKAIFFRTYFEAIAEDDESIDYLDEVTSSKIFTNTRIRTDKGHEYLVHCPMKPLTDAFDLPPRKKFKKGDVIVRGYVDTGDHVFVDKLTYHFVRPRHDQVFVFSTRNIERLTRPGSPSQFYIKRLVGLPGDKLRVDPPKLFINDTVAPYGGMRRVMTGTEDAPKTGYRGYGLGDRRWGATYLIAPDESFEVPATRYWAMGDNSYNSFDSRGWGTVPQENIAGRALFVYYPFASHFGWIW